MNNKEAAILRFLANHENHRLNQRQIAKAIGISIGNVNQTLREMLETNLLQADLGVSKVETEQPKKAIILAAGYGMRMVPINLEYSKGLLEIKGEPLIERLIKQLHMSGVLDIQIVVGFMKERYEYLIDKYQVSLVVNSEYAERKNPYSLYLASKKTGLAGTYVVPCDVYFTENPFAKRELFSWYLVSKIKAENSNLRLNRNYELVPTRGAELGNQMVGIAYFSQADGAIYEARLAKLVQNGGDQKHYWERILIQDNNVAVHPQLIASEKVHEINTYEQLRDLDDQSNQLDNEAISIIADTLQVSARAIHQIKMLKKGMTNRSFLFKVAEKQYIMRIPGAGTNELINRQQETTVYKLLQSRHIKFAEPVLYINPENGYKLTEFIGGRRGCDPTNVSDLKKCMAILRSLHRSGLKVDFTFNLAEQINFYEKLRGSTSNYRDYEDVKQRVWELFDYVNQVKKPAVLCHIDANADNFLLNSAGEPMLIDWEYAAMQDPDVDIAMFAIYAMYNKAEIDQLIDIYYQGQTGLTTRTKIYAYIAICGLLWSNWCEYKNSLGIDFGEYSLKQYRYAKEYSRIVHRILEG